MIANKVLFICTGNYYRSRFAEMLFNKLAKEHNLHWEASSRGVAVGKCKGNVGPISKYALEGLLLRNIVCEENIRYPVQVSITDLQEARIIIALKESEHRPYIQSLFANWEEKTEFWEIHDIDVARPDEALPELGKKVDQLITEIKMTKTY